ncbi:MAG: type II toxin-antitoxin system VapC family toxin [Rhizobiales bacterium]|nr:type II toxin-antitoxin system VapC family toxin [Hyphomicrobiales bacterium]
MALLLDTHLLIDFTRRPRVALVPSITDLLAAGGPFFASVASLWEIAIKTRLGKLDPHLPIEDISGYLESMGFAVLTINQHHVVYDLDPLPPTRDPFDRLLLAQCAVERLRLVTLDRALVDHPLAWRPT